MSAFESDGKAAADRAARRRREGPGRGRKVAVIEDDRSTSALLITLLQLEGYSAASFDNIPEIGEQLRAAAIDFVLCDDNMPGLRGSEVIAAIRARRDLDAVPVVLMSGIYLDDLEWRALQADGFLLKPFSRQDLLDALQRVETVAGDEE